MSFPLKLKRRSFLRTSFLGFAGLSGFLSRGQSQEKETSSPGATFPRIKEYRLLGRTGFKVSDIGAGSIQDEGVLRAALEAGVNYIDTAEEYPGHHRVVAQAIKGRDRKSIFITTKLAAKNPDESRLQLYQQGCGQLYCRHACGLCEPACPQKIPVNTIMRYHYYFSTQAREKEAMSLYQRLPGKKAEGCHECPGYCEKTCPYGVPIQGMLLLAHQTLTFA